MRAVIYSTKAYEREFLDAANAEPGVGARPRHELIYREAKLSLETTSLAHGIPAASIFVGDDASAPVLRALHAGGTRVLALRSAGFNHVDVDEADRLGITVLRVPAYSPHSVAEHTLGLILTLNRKFHRAYNRVREQNFSLDGLMGFDLHGKSVGVIGTGKIGEALCRALIGLGCQVLACDPTPNPSCLRLGVRYACLDELLRQSDVVSLHCPLTPSTRHLIDARALSLMKLGAMLINTSRGAVIDTKALIAALKSRRLGSVGLDVYEEEADLFFRDLSDQVIHDDVFVRLLSFPNVLITAHQGFFTREACAAIASTTVSNLSGFEHGQITAANRVTGRLVVRSAPASPC